MTGFENVLHWTLIWHALLLLVLALLTVGQGMGGWTLAWWWFPTLALVGATPFLVVAWMCLLALTGWTL